MPSERDAQKAGPPADPAARAAYALLADGSTVEIRMAGPADAGAIRQMHEQMSPGNAYFRFFSFSPQAPEREAQRLTRPPAPTTPRCSRASAGS